MLTLMLKRDEWCCFLFKVRLFCFLLCMACISFLTISNAWGVTGSRIDSIEVRVEEQGVFVDAQMRIRLSAPMRDALEKGVSLYFVATTEIKRKRWYWFDAVDAYVTRVIRLSYVPLLQQYRVTIGGVHQTFYSLDEALTLLSQIAYWRIGDAQLLERGKRQILTFSFELDHAKLPRLFQIGIGKDENWQLKLTQDIELSKVQ